MTNTVNFNNKSVQAAAVAALKDLVATNGEEKTMDELYEAVRKQVQVTREQFEELFKQAKEKMDSWEKDESASTELKEDELDMVVGGGVLDWIKDHGKEIAIIAGVTLFCALGAGAAGASILLAFEASSLTSGAVVGGLVGGAIGFTIGYNACFNNEKKE